ncbi:MAG: biotin transporter BioY [Clostridia bacterium]|nr:biotin transporter BioY [Clostridia bacterium]
MPRLEKRRSLQHLTVCALFAALISVLSPIAVPIGPIPVSLGLLGVLITAATLSPVGSLTAVAVFMALGLCGLPVFSGGGSGAMIFVGPTGGYLWSYLLVAPLVSLFCRLVRRARSNVAAIFWTSLACLAGVVICYICGTVQYIFLMQTSLLSALAVCVLPFLPFDIAKSILAAYLATKLKNILGTRV